VSCVQIFIGRSAVQNRRIMPCANWPDITNFWNTFWKHERSYLAQLRGCTIQEDCGYFPKIWEPPQNSMHLTGVMKNVPYWRPTNNRRHRKIIWRHDDLALGTCVPCDWHYLKISCQFVHKERGKRQRLGILKMKLDLVLVLKGI